MRRIIVAFSLLGLFVSSSFAIQSGLLPYGIGARYAGMGGAASAIVDDITSAYYNPAGIVKSGRVELKLGAGAATAGLADILKVASNASDPAKFIADNVTNTININGGVNGLVGLNIARIGVTVIPLGNLSLVKVPGFNGNATARFAYEGILTMGYGLSTPILPVASLDLGLNVKYIGSVLANSGAALNLASNSITNLSGTGFDIGAKAKIDTFAIPFSAAIVIKDLGASLSGKTKSNTTTYNPITGTTSNSADVETDASATSPTTLVIGASTTIPGIGLKVAADIDSVSGSGASYSVTHLGVEYPLTVVALRAGYVTGNNGNISMTTIGAGFNFFGNLNIAMIMDGKDSNNNSMIFDTGFAF